jgi:hypothetical protein
MLAASITHFARSAERDGHRDGIAPQQSSA